VPFLNVPIGDNNVTWSPDWPTYELTTAYAPKIYKLISKSQVNNEC